MKNAPDQTTIEGAHDKADYTAGRWQAAHTLARRIPALPEPEKCAAVSLLLAKLLDLLRTAAA